MPGTRANADPALIARSPAGACPPRGSSFTPSRPAAQDRRKRVERRRGGRVQLGEHVAPAPVRGRVGSSGPWAWPRSIGVAGAAGGW